MGRNYLFTFSCSCGFKPCNFVVFAHSEANARVKLWTTVYMDQALEIQGCSAPNIKDIISGHQWISYTDNRGNYIESQNFHDFVHNVQVTRQKLTPVFFCSCTNT